MTGKTKKWTFHSTNKTYYFKMDELQCYGPTSGCRPSSFKNGATCGVLFLTDDAYMRNDALIFIPSDIFT